MTTEKQKRVENIFLKLHSEVFIDTLSELFTEKQ